MKTLVWHRTVCMWLAILTAVYAINQYEAYWFIVSASIVLIVSISMSSGYHRLFNHRSFVCNRVWHWIFGLIGCASLNSSPLHWSIVHTNHHKYSDTPKDPYVRSLSIFFMFKDRSMKVFKNDILLSRDPLHILLAKHSMTISILYLILVASILGIEGVIFLYLLPFGWFIIGGNLHVIFAHNKDGPVNRWWLEFLIPAGGEWLHKQHHKLPYIYDFKEKWYHYDPGSILINLIKHDKV